MKTKTIILLASLACVTSHAQQTSLPTAYQETVFIELSSVKPLNGAREPILSIERIHLALADSSRFIEAHRKDTSGLARPSLMVRTEAIPSDAPVLCHIHLPGEKAPLPIRLVGLTVDGATSIDAVIAAAPSYLEREVVKLLVHSRKEEFDGYISRILGDRPTSTKHPEIGVPYRAHINWAEEKLK